MSVSLHGCCLSVHETRVTLFLLSFLPIAPERPALCITGEREGGIKEGWKEKGWEDVFVLV